MRPRPPSFFGLVMSIEHCWSQDTLRHWETQDFGCIFFLLPCPTEGDQVVVQLGWGDPRGLCVLPFDLESISCSKCVEYLLNFLQILRNVGQHQSNIVCINTMEALLSCGWCKSSVMYRTA